MPLHLNIEDLLSARTVESDRIEYKEGWNPDAIYRTICAFANDFDNTDGGYILVGVKEDPITKTAVRPVKGITTAEIGNLQQKMIGFNNLINPVYSVKLDVVDVDDHQIVVLWAPGGPNRPYQVPEKITAREKRYFYYIRKYANSVKANIEEQQELISLANQIPFDDRSNTQAKMENISMVLVKDHLVKVNSRLAEQVGMIPDRELLGQMELISGPNERILPRNVGLMLFAEHPEKFFPYTQVDIVEFPEGDAGPYIEQGPITGPVPEQIYRTLNFLKDKLVRERVIKPSDKAESIRITSYPYQAIEETLVNAFYHRDYQQREPIEIRIYPNSIIFINHGGPDRSIRLEAFGLGQVRSRRYRNRRLGEFLKELGLTEGRGTGIPTVLKALKENGSPAPRFLTDDDRTVFEVELFIHPAFEESAPIEIDLSNVTWNLQGVDYLLNLLLQKAWGGVVRDIAGDKVEDTLDADKQAINVISALAGDIAGDIAGGIARGIAAGISEKMIQTLSIAQSPAERKELLKVIGLASNVKNFNTYIAPLVAINWLTMTIPDKPTSPNQKYITTLKGRLVLEFLKMNTK
jgi:ATP-dependent DNA helicase RecG